MNYEWLDEYLLSKLGVTKDFKEEWEWDRYLLNGKMIAAICTDKTGKEIITLKCEPSFGEELRIQYEDIIPGYYMNKVHWNSVYLEGEVPDEVIKDMIDQSYELIFNKLSKKMQNEIRNGDKND
ncbi:MmcQ/YjbR family DNA-binding protein [Iocasia frigidifontis]|uniref:MmcQ/YjbR family DNA-binding protein n=1 Tax=Iocasia fonsfrigidae TaxID=2682810 RepID=A0A8A7K8L3_9FIRM|nr:MmcQ/YjbR family DNA-binding protein [Iocasia fonsfrigidae]QTL97801.1 MmcQ/YjbR family DNA-binding protein [Iocasia fonsfrigidae]